MNEMCTYIYFYKKGHMRDKCVSPKEAREAAEEEEEEAKKMWCPELHSATIIATNTRPREQQD